MRSSKSVDKPVTQARLPAERFELRHSFYMQETINWSSKLIFQRKVVGDSPLMSEECSIADSKQTDFGFGVDARAEDPLRPDPPCPVRLFCMTLSWVRMGSPLSPYPVLPARLSHMTLSWDGWDLPCWLPASPLFYLRQPDAIQS